MGRPKRKDTVDEGAQQSQANVGGGITTPKLIAYWKEVNKLTAQMDKIRGELGQEFKQFEEDGGNKVGFKWAQKLAGMEPAAAQDAFRFFERCCHEMGVFRQLDLLDKNPNDPKAAAPAEPDDEDGDGDDTPPATRHASSAHH